MKKNNSNARKLFSFLAVFSVLFVGTFSVSAVAESDDEASDSSVKKTPWLEAKERAEERKEQVERNREERQMMLEERKTARQEKICENLAERSSRLQERLGDRYEKIMERKAKRTTAFDEKRDERDVTLDEQRAERDANRTEMYEKLVERAGDDATKKAAVSAFQSAVEQAVSDRKKAVDAAITAFRSGIDTALGNRKNTIEASVADFKSAIEQAVSEVKKSCEAGTDPATVRATFEASLKAARADISDDRAAAEKVGTQVKALAETKRAAFLSAHETFKVAMEKARSDLKAAFGGTQDDEESEE